MSHELFANVCSMHDIVNTYYTLRVDNEGTPAILVSFPECLNNTRAAQKANFILGGVLCLHLRISGIASVEVSSMFVVLVILSYSPHHN